MNNWHTNDKLFAHRTPEAAARQLAVVLASATEWNLATLERMSTRKTTPKYDIKRQTEICEKLVQHCKELGVSPSGLRGVECGRLKEALAPQK